MAREERSPVELIVELEFAFGSIQYKSCSAALQLRKQHRMTYITCNNESNQLYARAESTWHAMGMVDRHGYSGQQNDTVFYACRPY